MASTRSRSSAWRAVFPVRATPPSSGRILRDGVESIRDLTESELLAAGASAEDLANPDYVRRAAILDGVPLFDASFFGFSPRDASIMDPQHRHFLECAWEALEDAAHPPQLFRVAGSIGVFAGSGMNTYLIHNLLANRRLLESAGLFQLKQTGNDKDVLATRVSLSVRPARAQHQCANRLLHFARRRASGLPEPAQLRVRHGSGRRRHDRDSARARLRLPRGRNPFARRPLPAFRCQFKRHGFFERPGHRGPAPP